MFLTTLLLAGVSLSLSIESTTPTPQIIVTPLTPILSFSVVDTEPLEQFFVNLDCSLPEGNSMTPYWCNGQFRGNLEEVNRFLSQAEGFLGAELVGKLTLRLTITKLSTSEIASTSIELFFAETFPLEQLKDSASERDELPLQVAAIPEELLAVPFTVEVVSGSEFARVTRFGRAIELEAYGFSENQEISFYLLDPISGVKSETISLTLLSSHSDWTRFHSLWILIIVLGAISVLGCVLILVGCFIREKFAKSEKFEKLPSVAEKKDSEKSSVKESEIGDEKVVTVMGDLEMPEQTKPDSLIKPIEPTEEFKSADEYITEEEIADEVRIKSPDA